MPCAWRASAALIWSRWRRPHSRPSAASLITASSSTRTQRNRKRRRRSRSSSSDRKSTRLNPSHRCISYAVFCLKKKKEKNREQHTGQNQRAAERQPHQEREPRPDDGRGDERRQDDTRYEHGVRERYHAPEQHRN